MEQNTEGNKKEVCNSMTIAEINVIKKEMKICLVGPTTVGKTQIIKRFKSLTCTQGLTSF
jgi:flagellar biosynthesis GTPase FlhF